MTAEEQAAALLAGYVRQTSAVRDWVTARVRAVWAALGYWDDDGATRFAADLAPVLVAARDVMTQLTAAHLDTQLALARGVDLTPTSRDQRVISPRGVSDTELLRRPFRTVWLELSRGTLLADAVARGGRRAESITATEVQLAKTHTSRDVLADSRHVTGYRRVLSDRDSCALCLIAATRIYRRRDLMPIHPGCSCGVAPLVAGHDPAAAVDAPQLDALHQVVAADLGQRYVRPEAADPAAYQRLLATRDHGELGPVLTVRRQEFTGPGDLP